MAKTVGIPQLKAPLVKGGEAAVGGRGDSVKSRHVPALTPRAKELRKNMTQEERHLWYDFLRNYPVRFLRQKVIDGYIVDFYCASAKIAIELDGSQHYTSNGREYDKERDKLLSAWGIEVIRFPNQAVRDNFENICRYIEQVVKSRIETINRK